MPRAFVIEWNDKLLSRRVVGARYIRNCFRDSDYACRFLLEKLGNWYDTTWALPCYYPTRNAYDAKVLTRLMKQVQSYQRLDFVQNNVKDTDRYTDTGKKLDHVRDCWTRAMDVLEKAGTKEDGYIGDYSNRTIFKDMPFEVREFDETVDLKPCFFVQEYKMHDENGHPIYLIVALEKDGDASDENELFRYKVKFIGSGQPLSKLAARIPLCNDKEIYNLKVEEYRVAKQDYYRKWRNEICRTISDPDFCKRFNTYTYETERWWNGCEITIGGKYCAHRRYDYSRGGYFCNYRNCPFDRGIESRHATHDGKRAYQLFENAFGEEIAKLVKQGKFNRDKWSLMPDVSDPKFIRAFKKFCVSEYDAYRGDDNDIRFGAYAIRYFDDDGCIAKRENVLDDTIKRIQDWASNPNEFILRLNGRNYTIPVQREKQTTEPEKDEDQEAEPAPDLKTQLAELKSKLLTNNMYRVKYPAILISYPGKVRIDSAIDGRYMYYDEKSKEYYEPYMDVDIYYKKPKSEPDTISYRFTHILLGYDLQNIMEFWGALHDKYPKWGPTKLFRNATDDVINVERCNVDYNGITILNPKNSRVTCDHYELHTIDVGCCGGADLHTAVLFNKNDEVSGIIYSRDNINAILPCIITRNKTKQR